MTRRAFAAVVAACLAVSACSGCSRREAEPEVNVNDAAVAYVTERYGYEFRYAGPTGDSLSGTHSCLVRCDEVDAAVVVEVEDYGTDDPVYRDNLVAVRYADETRAVLADCARLVAEDVEVYYAPASVGYEELPADADLETFLRDASVPFRALIKMRDYPDSSYDDLAAVGMRVWRSMPNFRVILVVLDDESYDACDAHGAGVAVTTGAFVRAVEVCGEPGCGVTYRRYPDGGWE